MVRNERHPRTIADVLVGTHNLLANPAAWSRRAGARTATGDRCDSCSPAATSWCLWGAIENQLGLIPADNHALRVILTTAVEMHLLATARIQMQMPELDDIAQFSDDRSTTHEDVLELLDVALFALHHPTSSRLTLRSNRSVNACRA